MLIAFKNKPQDQRSFSRLNEAGLAERELERAFRTERASKGISERNQDSSPGYGGINGLLRNKPPGSNAMGEVAPVQSDRSKYSSDQAYIDALVGDATADTSGPMGSTSRSSSSGQTAAPVQRSVPVESSLVSGDSGLRVRSRSNRKSKASAPAPVRRVIF